MNKKFIDGSRLSVEKIGDSIFHINMLDKNELAEAVMRFQEYYESPFDDIRGKVFTMGYLKSKGAGALGGVNTYAGNPLMEATWDGYNFPGHVLKPFIQGLFDPLTEEEKAIVELFRYKTDDFYVIATYGDEDKSDTLEHEVRHGMYGVCPEYRAEVNKLISKYSAKLAPLKKCLASWGYHSDVLTDECHAYMGADHDYFFESFTTDILKFKISEMPKLRDSLNSLAVKYKLKLNIN